ncbi:MAG: ATP-binding protein [Myxococcota bacterium]|nr:ATP-binding protein [Myxococcota bacterium]
MFNNEDTQLHTGRVIVVDADAIAPPGVWAALEEAGHEVRAVEGLSEALTSIEQIPPHVLIFAASAETGVDTLLNRASVLDPTMQVLAVGDPGAAANEASYKVGSTQIVSREELLAAPLAIVEKALACFSERESAAGHQDDTASYGDKLLACISSALIGLNGYGVVRLWNSTTQDTFGLPGPKALGRPFAALPIEWRDEDVVDKIYEASLRETPTRIDDLRFVGPSGKERFLGMTVNPIPGRNPARRGMLILARDITDVKAVSARLLNAQKLESIWELAGGMAHEINTPLQYITDNLDFISDAIRDITSIIEKIQPAMEQCGAHEEMAAEMRTLKEKIEQSDVSYLAEETPLAIDQTREGITHISKIVGAMISFSAPNSLDKVAVDINQAIGSTLTISAPQWKEVAEVETDLQEGLPPVHGMPGDLNQAFLHIIVNAAQAISERAQQAGGHHGKISIKTRSDGDGIGVSIADNGMGIPDDVLPRIFEPLFSTKEVGSGHGQGLTVARAVIVEEHGGDIQVHSVTGEGTEVTMRLPAAL